MAIVLKKGDRIDLTKKTGQRLVSFAVGCNWGQIVEKTFFGLFRKTKDVDIDLSCVMKDANGNVCDHIYSPLYKHDVLRRFGLPPGKLYSNCKALRHTGDDLTGDAGGEDDGYDNEVITVNLQQLSHQVEQIYFFLNICGDVDFSQVPYASIRMFEFEGTPDHIRQVFASYNVAALPQYAGRKSLILAKLYRQGGEWRFVALGEPTSDQFVGQTVVRIANSNL